MFYEVPVFLFFFYLSFTFLVWTWKKCFKSATKLNLPNYLCINRTDLLLLCKNRQIKHQISCVQDDLNCTWIQQATLSIYSLQTIRSSSFQCFELQLLHFDLQQPVATWMIFDYLRGRNIYSNKEPWNRN